MQKLIEFSKKYQLLDLLLILFVFCIFFNIFYAKIGTYLIDVGREAYVPWQMLEGKILYKDIFNVYGPLGYQINTLAFMIFGSSLKTLYFMGAFASTIILFCTYYCVNLFTTRKIAISCCLLALSVCVFSKNLFNFIFPYSYSAVFALSSFLISLLLALIYIKKQNFKYIVLSFLLAGFSFANKIEYLPYFGFLFVSLPFLLPQNERKNWKKYIICYSSFFVFPIVSFGSLLLQGTNFSDFTKAFKYSIQLVKTPAAEYFYNAYGLIFNPLHILYSLKILFKVLIIAIPTAITLYFLNFANEKFIKNKIGKIVINLTSLYVIISLSILILNSYSNLWKSFCWLGVCAILTLFCFVIYSIYQKFKNKTNPYYLEKENKMFLFVLISSILVSLKGIWDISIECYGTFSLAVLFIPFLIFFSNYLSQIKFIDKTTLEKTIINLCFIVFIIFSLNRIGKLANIYTDKAIKEKGPIFVEKTFKSQPELINYIKANTPKNATIVSLPEGAIINFLTERKSHNWYFYLIPVNVQLFKEENIVKDFEKEMPDYFLINYLPYDCYNVGSICSYAPQICNFIEKNYELVIKTNDLMSFYLYQKK